MNGSLDWRDAKYEETYAQELLGLERRREHDPGFSITDLEALLRHLYAMDGADWVGRGLLQDTIMEATLAAHESFLAQWRAEDTAAEDTAAEDTAAEDAVANQSAGEAL